MKHYNYKAVMTQLEKKINNAKKVDYTTIRYYIYLLKDMDAYKCVTEDKQARMEDDVRYNTLHKRLVYFVRPYSF